MWYVLLAVMIIAAILGCGLFPSIAKEAHDYKERRRLEKIGNFFMIIEVVCGAIFIFTGIGWLWYFLGGFLVIDCSDGFWDYFFNGLISLIPLFGIIGVIMIFFGWNPNKK